MRTRPLAVLALSFLSLGFAIAADEAPKNLATNGDFETPLPSGTTLPKDWSLFSKPEGSYKTSVVDAGHGGKKSLLVEGDGEFAVVSPARIAFDGKSRYAVKGAVKVEGEGAKATIKFDYFDGEWKWLGSTSIGEITADMKGWHVISVTDRCAIEAPKAKHVSVGLQINGKGKAWFDDIELTPATGDAATSLIDNGDFENSLGAKPAQWWTGSADGGKVEALVSIDQPKSGKHCMQLKGNADWAVAASVKWPYDKKKTYEITGFVRTKAGSGQIKIDYYTDDQYIGSTFGEDVSDDAWTEKTVSTTDEFPNATHIAAVLVGAGEFDVRFDAITVKVK